MTLRPPKKKKQSQIDFVIERLRSRGEISRNFCLQYQITRLAAIIDVLNNRKWVIEGERYKTEDGVNYVYVVVEYPPKKVAKYIGNNTVKFVYERQPANVATTESTPSLF